MRNPEAEPSRLRKEKGPGGFHQIPPGPNRDRGIIPPPRGNTMHPKTLPTAGRRTPVGHHQARRVIYRAWRSHLSRTARAEGLHPAAAAPILSPPPLIGRPGVETRVVRRTAPSLPVRALFSCPKSIHGGLGEARASVAGHLTPVFHPRSVRRPSAWKWKAGGSQPQ
jgi:hypothetical protein